MRIQVYVSDELGERIARAAEKDQRSVSQWVALVLEDRLTEDDLAPSTRSAHAVKRLTSDDPPQRKPEVVKLMSEPSVLEAPTPARSRPKASGSPRTADTSGCAHARTVKRTTGALGTRTFCEDCGALV